jgi:antitoxin HicB
MMSNNTNRNIGSDFDDFLKEEDIFEETQEAAIKRVLAYQIKQAMKEQNITKSAMAKKMKTSRCSLDRLLDPNNEAITLQTMKKAANAVGMRLRIELA